MRGICIAALVIMSSSILAGCVGGVSGPPESTASPDRTSPVPSAVGQAASSPVPLPRPSPTGEPAAAVPSPPQPRGAAEQADAARVSLARRLGISPQEIIILSVSEETWRDASLGCPEAGKVYAQVLTPGSRIVLEARGQRHEYHSGGDQVVYCEKPG